MSSAATEITPDSIPVPPIVAVRDERDPLARAALELVREMFSSADRQSTTDLLSEVAEARLGVLDGGDFHLLAAPSESGEVLGTALGVYMEGTNAGIVTYLAVRPAFRGRELARTLRTTLVECFRRNAREMGRDDLAWVLGEVRAESPWLQRLVRHRGAIPFDLTYYHPGMVPGDGGPPYVLYRQPVGDFRPVLPAALVRQAVYDIYRRTYRVRYPLSHPGFAAMMAELEGRDEVGRLAGFDPD